MLVHIFGDQTARQLPFLRKVISRKDNALLSTFLERCNVALREEIDRLPQVDRPNIPDFLSISHLVEAYFDKDLRVPQLESSLLTITQLGHFIGYYGENPSEWNDAVSTRAIGLCTGILAASAVSCARSLCELLPLAIEAVRISFRAGNAVQAMRSALAADDGNASWSTIVTNTNEDTLQSSLANFHESNSVSSHMQAYISAVSMMAFTVSGPPGTVSKFLQNNDALRDSNRVPIPVYGPYHASHLYSTEDINTILDTDTKRNLQSFRRNPNAQVVSSATGQCHQSTSATELFQLGLEEMLKTPVRWDSILQETVSEIPTDCSIHAFGITNIANSFVSALKSGNSSSKINLKDHTSWGAPSKTFGRTQNDKIAIVGMAGRFPTDPNADLLPSSAGPDALWEILEKGMDVHREIPPDRFDAKAHVDPSGKGKNKSHSPYGCFIDEPGLFDPRFFNMSPREAAQTDPMGRLALVTAYEALEMSGYVANRTPSTKLNRIGTFYGQTSDDWREINAAENVDTYFITGGVRAFAPGRINYYFKFSGPSYSVDTACSSSLAAVQLACTSLWAGDCDTACAGGLNVLTNPDIFAGLSKGQFLSKTGSCKTYDNGADGYCRGDGCATVVLKRYEDAIADKDNILGCILSAATNHSAEAVSITHPHAGAQEFLYKQVLATAGVDPHEVSYVEMHGTGTQAGDGIEMTSVSNTFAPRGRQRTEPVYLGAVKANIGHGEAASGTNSLIKVLMMMQKNMIPANIGIKTIINQTFPKDLEQRKVIIPTTNTPYLRPREGKQLRKLFLNNFSAAGGNTALLLEDGPLRETPRVVDPRGTHIITVSAGGIAALKRNIERLVEWLDQNPETTLPSLSYTTTARRLQHHYRIAITVANMADVRSALKAQIKDSYSPISTTLTPRVAFCFTGQGSQYAGLGRKFYDELPSFKVDIDRLASLAQLQGFPSFIPIVNGTAIEALSPVVVQLGMACIQVALSRLWASLGVKPSAVVGHSLGEYAALHVAGVLSASDMIFLVGKRAQLLERHCTKFSHSMLAVKADLKTVTKLIGDKMADIELSCVNSPDETVLGATNDNISFIQNLISLKSPGMKCFKLNVPYAFHSSQVVPIMELFKIIAAGVTYQKPQIPVLSPLTGGIIRDTGVIGPEYLVRHARETVNFWGALSRGMDPREKLLDEKTVWVEIGAHPICLGMVRACLGNLQVKAAAPSLRRNEDPWRTLAGSLSSLYLAGVPIDFNEYHKSFNEAHELLSLPKMSFDEKNYWLDYHNNWTLTKGEAPAIAAPVIHKVEAKSKFSTTTCQRITSEDIQKNVGTIVIQTDLTEPNLWSIVTGHKVNGQPLCPSSLYGDMAMTAADYLYKKLRPDASPIGLNVCSMEVHKPLIIEVPAPADGQHLQLEASADVEHGIVNLTFRYVKPDGTVIRELVQGLVKYEDINDWAVEWARVGYMVQTQIDILQQQLHTGGANKILQRLGYKLFKSFVDYSELYQGMKEITLHNHEIEASAKVRLYPVQNGEKYHCPPHWIDSLAHLSGFVLNGTDLAIDIVDNICISHGWTSIRFARPFSSDKEYTSYVRMQPAHGNASIFVGDIYVFEEGEVVGVVGGLKFQSIPRKAFNIMVPNPALKKGSAPPPAITMAAQKTTEIKKMSTSASTSTNAAPSLKVSTMVTATEVTPTAETTTTTVTVAQSGPSMVSRVMNIIAEETELDMSELVAEAAFENLGVDSLLSLTISARFREELGFEISSTLFTDYATIGEMQKYFSQYDSPEPAPAVNTSAGSTPEIVSYDSDSASEMQGSEYPTPLTAMTEFSSPDDLGLGPQFAFPVPASRSGISEGFIDLGKYSMQSSTVGGFLSKRTSMNSLSTVAITNATLENSRKPNRLGAPPKSVPRSLARPAEQRHEWSAPDITGLPAANSVMLQGSGKNATKKLFLLPDGSGSATSYVSIPNISTDMKVYGLNCPFMKKPENFTCTVEQVSHLYLNEIRRRQPRGPYMIGGWSAGGVFAYEVARQIIMSGGEVEKLILLDAPCPVALAPLPTRLHRFFDQIGLLGTGKAGGTPGWLLPHFAAAVKALSDYDPPPFPRGLAPRTAAIWCTDGVCKNPSDPRPPPSDTDEEDPAPMIWLLNNRTDFTDNGWSQLVDKDNMEFYVMSGNHFTMMKPPNSESLGQHIRTALGYSSS
ncbi:polyketide synthase-like protein [Microthyrium microscopicum]|uniref:Polyketide synthase-like protein n=1 Tax=Microthyrium microscopicum TaxID=703497 RepID=A0A6A6UIN3_9PEZI|nr:polyketide synthase-like protein [Microthyrium microscopicum]